MQERVQKLLILAGDEGAHLQSRDFDRIKKIIVDEYLATVSEQEKKSIVDILIKAVQKVPCKQHIYAGLVTKVNEINSSLVTYIVDQLLLKLQGCINGAALYEALNIINFFSELMNISLLNSLAFINILEDILDSAESESDERVKRFLIKLLLRSLPICMDSLNQKLRSELKAFIKKLQKVCGEKDPLLALVELNLEKEKRIGFSKIPRLECEFALLDNSQLNPKFKLSVKVEGPQKQIQYFNLMSASEDKLYKEFLREEGHYHQTVIEQLIEQFYSKNSILFMKLQNYVNSIEGYKAGFCYRMLFQTLISKGLKSERPLVEQSLSLLFVNSYTDSAIKEESEEHLNKLSKNDVAGMLEGLLFELFTRVEQFEYTAILKIADFISFVYNGWRDNEWDWEKYILNEEEFVRREVLLLLILEKVKVLNDKFETPEILAQLPQFKPATNLKNQQEYTEIEEMEKFEAFEAALASKKEAAALIEMIDSPKDYEFFLEALFRRTSLSLTHLKVLIERYRGVLEHFREHDWTLINKVRNFWKHSYTSRQMYLQTLIRKEFTTFNSYVNYIGKLDSKSKKEVIWNKVEISQLNSLFGKK